VKHELTQEEITTACNEYVLKHHYPSGTWAVRTSVDAVTITDASHAIGPLKPEEVVGKPMIFRIVVDVSDASKKEPT
jgi:hypothetical protein